MPRPTQEDKLVVAATFAPRLRLARERRKLSQAKLANLVGVDRALVCKWEGGQRLPSVTTLVRLAEVLRCRVGDLVG